MSFINPDSCSCAKSELDLESIPPTQTAIDHSTFVEYRPVSTLSDDGPIEFSILGDSADYIDPAHIYAYIRCNITKSEGGN